MITTLARIAFWSSVYASCTWLILCSGLYLAYLLERSWG